MILIVLASIVLFLSLYLGYYYYFCPKREIERCRQAFESQGYSVYVRPFKFFGFRAMAQIQESQKKYKDALYLEKSFYSKYDVNISNILNRVLVVLVNPDLMKEFLSAETNQKYPKIEFLNQGVKRVLGNGIAFTEGAVWKNKRKIISKAFNFELLKENIPKIVQICNRAYQQYEKQGKIDEKTVQYNVNNFSVRAFNGVMLKSFFGCDQVKTMVEGESFEQFMVKMINKAAMVSSSPLVLFFGKAFQYGITAKIRDVKRSIAIFRSIAGQMIQDRIQEVNKEEPTNKFTDIIQSLVYEKKALAEKNEKLEYSNADLIDEFSTFLVAGTDTTSRYFTMIVYYLSQHPEVEKKLRAVVDEVIKTDKDITYENLKKLVYIDWIQFETTRYYGPGNGIFIREATVDNYLLSVPITKGTLITIQPAGNHYSQKYFKDPFVFRPERWESQCDNLHPYAFLGFSGGSRNCLGKHLALLQSKIALVKLIKRYKTLSVPQPDIIMCNKFMYEPSEFITVFTK